MIFSTITLNLYLIDSRLVIIFIGVSALIMLAKLAAWAWDQIPFIG